jgi:UDP-4-amino-4-deoxy-L-arabinose-oxoglutarate aminotransferase
MVGAKPVFVDVDPDTLLLDPQTAARAITPATRAIIPVHLYGQMCDMIGLRHAVAHRPDITIIEDAAHCFEGTREGYRPGSQSDLAIFSFYATKNVTCGEGGAIAIGNTALTERLTHARLHGMTAGAIDRYQKDQYRHWDMVRLGCKANMPDLLAALLPKQIETIDAKLQVRKRLADRYRDAFAGGPVRIPSQLPNAISAEHVFVIHVPPAVRDKTILLLNSHGIGVGVHFRAVHTTTFYRERYGYASKDFPVSYEWGEGVLTLPLYPSLTDEEQQYVIDVVKDHVFPLCWQAIQ